jgi:hypothetical protein
MDKPDKTLFSIQMSNKDKEMFEAVSKYRDTPKSGVLRQWIRKAYAALPVEAK